MATKNSDPEQMLKLNKCDLAISLHEECSQKGNVKTLHDILNNLLNPFKPLNDDETIDWCKWIIGGGRSPDKFANLVRSYDNANTCGFVWTPKYIAYRCRTCGIEACMSLCGDCFRNGNHDGHDVIQFPSQSGGQCDCGNTDVMKEMGFCHNHGPNKKNNNFPPPSDLLCIAKHMMPRIILRLIQALREISTKECNTTISNYVKEETEAYVKMLMDFSDMGNHMRQVISEALRSPEVYELLNKVPSDDNYTEYVTKNLEYYDNAIKELGLPEGMENFQNTPVFQKYVTHNTFLEELTFWMVKFEFPQNVVCLLLNLLQESHYKEAFADTFVFHYIRLPLMLEKVAEIDDVGNRIVQTTVQLFTNESLVTRMNERHNLLLIMIVSLKYLICRTITPSSNGEVDHQVADCSSYILKNHYYWPIVSDFNNILQNHKSVALHFMEDDFLLQSWFSFISMFQGMNMNERETLEAIDVQSNWSAFAGEFEGVSEPTWTLVNHLTDDTTTYHSRRLLSACLTSIREWFQTINFSNSDLIDQNQISFHLPLHRIFAVLLSRAVTKQGMLLNEILPQDSETIKLLIMHPLILNVSFHEIVNKCKQRNDSQMPTQVITYTQCIFSNSMIDADFYLMQICCTRIPRNPFLSLLVSSFKVQDWTMLSNNEELISLSLKSFLTYLATLTCLRINLGMSKEEVYKLELATILSMEDSTRSHLLREVPNRGTTFPEEELDKLLKELAVYKRRYSMQDGIYMPTELVWEKYYDPIFIALRHVHVRNSMDRFLQYHANKHGYKLLDKSNYWLPYKYPVDCNLSYSDPRIVLQSRVFHAFSFAVLYKAVHCEKHSYDEALALMVFLLEMSTTGITFCSTEKNIDKTERRIVRDMDITTWYDSDCLKENIITEIASVESSKDDKNITTEINESIVSLLLKLHSKLSGAENSYNPDIHQAEASSSTCQEELYAITGPSAIGKFLEKMSSLSHSCRNYIKDTQSKLWPTKLVNETIKIKRKKELEEENKKKRISRERQKQVMMQLASQGKQFMEKMKSEAMDQTTDEIPESNGGVVCGICNENSNGTEMGVPAFVQGTKVVGTQRRHGDRIPLPTSNEEWELFRRDDTLTHKFLERAKLFQQHYQVNPFKQPIRVGENMGLHFHTCGHQIHISCLHKYRTSLPDIVEESDTSRFYMPSYYEYLCPTCCQLSNEVLPLKASIKKEAKFCSNQRTNLYKTICELRDRFDKIKGRREKYAPNDLYNAMESIVSHTRTALFKNDYQPELLEVSISHVRTILEVELLQRGGNLFSIEKPKSNKISRQNCLVPLLNVTNFYAKSTLSSSAVTIFRQLTFISKVPEKTLENDVPLMLHDPIAVLIWLIQVLGLEMEQIHFTTLVKMNYNLLYYQVLMQIFAVMPNSERAYFYKDAATKPNTLRGAMKLISKSFGHDIKKIDDDVNTTNTNSRANLNAIEKEVQNLCLPFLRIATLVKHYVYNQPLPEIAKSDSEFSKLVNFLELVVDKSQSFNAAAVLNWPSKNNFDTILPQTWCSQLLTLINRNSFVAKSLIRDQHISWQRPRLLQLPREYEKFFAYYYSKKCSRCNTIPEEASVCLVCGTLICKYQNCCKDKDHPEDIIHTSLCGVGTGIFLDASSTFVYIVFGIRAYSWGSPYLDAYEEEDRDLRRGKPLFLCSSRYQMLEDQWLSHRLDDLKNKKWVLHLKDPLLEYE